MGSVDERKVVGAGVVEVWRLRMHDSPGPSQSWIQLRRSKRVAQGRWLGGSGLAYCTGQAFAMNLKQSHRCQCHKCCATRSFCFGTFTIS